MGSDFIERNKRKSLWAALLLLLGGRGKYVVMFVVAAAVSVPFIVPGEGFSALFSSGPLRALMRAAGLTAMFEGASASSRGQDMISAAATAAATYQGGKASFWDRYLRAANAPLPPPGSPSSMGMLRGGADLAGPVEVKDKPGDKPRGAGQVKGVVNAQEREAGEAPAGVDVSGMLAGLGGGDYGGSMGEALSSRGSPYFNRSMMSSSGGAADRSAEMYAKVLDDPSRVPVPANSPKSLRGKTGKVSGFTWKNLGKKTARSRGIHGGMNTKRPRYQLAETVSMASLAFLSRSAEYEATYSGATYDGLDVEADGLTTGEVVAPTVPDTAFAENLMTDVSDMLDEAQACAEEAGRQGEVSSEETREMQEIVENMNFDSPPGCCPWDSSYRSSWNNKVDDIVEHCNAINDSSTELAAKCGTVPEYMDCNNYADLHIDCSWWDLTMGCFFEILAIAILAAIVGVAVFVCLYTGVFGQDAQNFTKGIIRKMAGYEEIEPPEVQVPEERGREGI